MASDRQPLGQQALGQLLSYHPSAVPEIVVSDIRKRELTCGMCYLHAAPGCPDPSAHPAAYGCPRWLGHCKFVRGWRAMPWDTSTMIVGGEGYSTYWNQAGENR